MNIILQTMLSGVAQEVIIEMKQQDIKVAKILGDCEPRQFYSLDLNIAVGLVVSEHLTLKLNCYNDGHGYMAKVGGVQDFEFAESKTHPADAIIKAWIKWKSREDSK